MSEDDWDKKGLLAKRRKEIRKLHFDLIDPIGQYISLPNTQTNFLGFHIRTQPGTFNVAQATEPGFANLRAYSGRQRVGWRTFTDAPHYSTIGIERAYPFNVFALDVCPANHENMTIQIIGDCLPNASGDPPANPDCKYWLTSVVVSASQPRTIYLNPNYYRNVRTFIIRESPLQADRNAKSLHPDAAPDSDPIIGITNIICKLTQEKYLDFPDEKGSFPN